MFNVVWRAVRKPRFFVAFVFFAYFVFFAVLLDFRKPLTDPSLLPHSLWSA